MQTIINYHSEKPSSAALEMLQIALDQIKGKSCISNGNNNRHVCIDRFVAEIEHNEYTSHITLRNHENGVEAYFCNGQFWTSITKRLVNLV